MVKIMENLVVLICDIQVKIGRIDIRINFMMMFMNNNDEILSNHEKRTLSPILDFDSD